MKQFAWLKAARSYLLPGAILAAGLASLALGVLPLPAFGELAARTIPILAFVLAMSLVTELVDEAGLFRVVTDRLAALGRGRVFLLWLLVVGVATVSTVFLSLDTTAVLVTPVVVLLAVHARIPPLPFALTSIWLANTASLLLPVSNLTNLLAQDRLGLSPWRFAGLVWAPSLVGLLVPLVLLWLAFRRDLRGTYGPQPAHPVRDPTLLKAAAITLLVLLPALVSGLPVQYPALAAAAVLLVVFLRRRPSVLRWSMVPWRPLMLTVGLFMLMETLHSHGLTTLLAGVAGSGDTLPALLQLAGVGAGAANAANNLPAYLALEPVAGSPARLAALLIGVNLGPLVTPWASLATLLWHERLRVLNVPIRWGGFAAAGLVAVAATVPLAVLALWLVSGMA
ncbi:Na+/H+ antiporter NhaD/arsenite permease-like protein [Arthrobacter oryzae]|uniref:SLC13 family permease n=1 Tax=Arthrobacter TaxID=1663 RepID=UPI001F44E475|nr:MULTISPECIES: SLC13 family permease [Arthrobacter]MDP9986320.1 Na+/H+ antiporter NhaD/arsenite permease-like protein [Arthrobacter oryzae]UKA70140.1 arsenic transporter [Arthrobacter sp. FW306-06-A]